MAAFLFNLLKNFVCGMYLCMVIFLLNFFSFKVLCGLLRPKNGSGLSLPHITNNIVCQHVKLRNLHHFVASARFLWSKWSEAHIVCGFSHQSSESLKCNRLSAGFKVWREKRDGLFFTVHKFTAELRNLDCMMNICSTLGYKQHHILGSIGWKGLKGKDGK